MMSSAKYPRIAPVATLGSASCMAGALIGSIAASSIEGAL